MESGKAVILILLDIPKGFEMIDHSILHDYLIGWCGVNDTMLTWIDSYLNSHKQNIKEEDGFSVVFHPPLGIT